MPRSRRSKRGGRSKTKKNNALATKVADKSSKKEKETRPNPKTNGTPQQKLLLQAQSQSKKQCQSKTSVKKKAKPKPHTVAIHLVKDIESTDKAISHLSQFKYVGFDCEGYRDLSRLGQIALIQLSSETSSYVFDIFAMGNTIPQSMRSFLQSSPHPQNGPFKVIHDSRSDVDALYHVYGIRVKGILDTTVADLVDRIRMCHQHVSRLRGMNALVHSMLGRCHQFTVTTPPLDHDPKLITDSKPIHTTPSAVASQVSIEAQSNETESIDNDAKRRVKTKINVFNIKDVIKNALSSDSKFWGKRPMSREMLIYAGIDPWLSLQLGLKFVLRMSDKHLTQTMQVSKRWSTLLSSKRSHKKGTARVPASIAKMIRSDIIQKQQNAKQRLKQLRQSKNGKHETETNSDSDSDSDSDDDDDNNDSDTDENIDTKSSKNEKTTSDNDTKDGSDDETTPETKPDSDVESISEAKTPPIEERVKRVAKHIGGAPPPKQVIIELITTEEGCEKAIEHLRLSKYVGFDCEGYKQLSRNGQVALIQLSSQTHAFVFDIFTMNNTIPACLTQFLQTIPDPKKGPFKFIHDSRADADALWHIYEQRLEGIIDTTVADLVRRICIFKNRGARLKSLENVADTMLNRSDYYKVVVTTPALPLEQELHPRPKPQKRKIIIGKGKKKKKAALKKQNKKPNTVPPTTAPTTASTTAVNDDTKDDTKDDTTEDSQLTDNSGEIESNETDPQSTENSGEIKPKETVPKSTFVPTKTKQTHVNIFNGKDKMKRNMALDSRMWGKRPMTREMLIYAGLDAWISLQIGRVFVKKLNREQLDKTIYVSRQWANLTLRKQSFRQGSANTPNPILKLIKRKTNDLLRNQNRQTHSNDMTTSIPLKKTTNNSVDSIEADTATPVANDVETVAVEEVKA